MATAPRTCGGFLLNLLGLDQFTRERAAQGLALAWSSTRNPFDMGKNKKDETPNPANVTNRDVLQRLNFLYQAGVLLNGLAPPHSISGDDEDGPSASSTTPNDEINRPDEHGPAPRPTKSQRKKRRVVSFGELSRSYIETMKTVGQKTNVRMDPSVKRGICKRCCTPLIPGISATVRVKNSTSHGHLISYRCRCCQTERRIPAPPVLHELPMDEGPVEARSPEAPNPSAIEAGSSVSLGKRKRKIKGPQPRLPPHFARDVGHIVFRGNERLDTTVPRVS